MGGKEKTEATTVPQRHSARLTSTSNSAANTSNNDDFTLNNKPKIQSKNVNFNDSNSSSVLSLSFNNNSNSKRQQLATSRSRHAELFRTDFITAMKIANTECLDEESYFEIKDPWKMDWEKGVQVPVKPDSLYTPNFMHKPDQYSHGYNNGVNNSIPATRNTSLLKRDKPMPRKYLCPTFDKKFDSNIHEAYLTHGLFNEASTTSKLVCRYDSDHMDLCWLLRVNKEFIQMGLPKLTRVDLERIIENFENQSHDNFKRATDKLESYSIEYDEGIVCDVCHLPDSEDANEMVFCDGCNICVHQACYGIAKIPQGNWLCVPCSFNGPSFKPECVLCPSVGGAMKATKNYRNWAHVSCALWIPEVGFGSAEKMEPIVNLNGISAARWTLVCGICKEKRGCCLQCSEKRCHATFHVSCGFKYNLQMQQEIVGGSDKEGDGDVAGGSSSGSIGGGAGDNIVFKAYCKTHTKKRQQLQNVTQIDYLDDADDIGDEEEEEKARRSDVYKFESDNNNNRKRKSTTPISSKKSHENDDKKHTKRSNSDTDSSAKTAISSNSDNDSESDNVSTCSTSSSGDPEHNLSLLANMSETERKVEIIKRILKLKRQFYKNISLDIARTQLKIREKLHVELVFGYWKLKRRFNKQSITLSDNKLMPSFDKALIPHKGYETDLLNRSEHLMIARIKMFHNLRQNLERLRTLSYMVIKREKLKKQLNETNQRLFEKQADYLCKYQSSSTSSFSNQETVDNNMTIALSRKGRFSDKLQIKNEACIYDFPELWINNNNKNANNTHNSDLMMQYECNNNLEFKPGFLSISSIKEDDSNQSCTPSAVASSSSSSYNKSLNIELDNLETSSSSTINTTLTSSISNSNKENYTSKKTTLPTENTTKKISSKSRKRPNLHNPTADTTNTTNKPSNSGKILTINKIKNKYKNISKKENRLKQAASKTIQIDTGIPEAAPTTVEPQSNQFQQNQIASSSLISQINDTGIPDTDHQSNPGQQVQIASSSLISQINMSIFNIKKSSNCLNLAHIKDTNPETNNNDLFTNDDQLDKKKLTNSTNTRATRLSQSNRQKSVINDTLASPLKRLNGHDHHNNNHNHNHHQNHIHDNNHQNGDYSNTNKRPRLHLTPATSTSPTSTTPTRFSLRINNNNSNASGGTPESILKVNSTREQSLVVIKK